MNPLENPVEPADVELGELIKLFYSDEEIENELGSFQECKREVMPEAYRRLLAHHQHMTVTVEQFHNSPVNLQVLASKTDGNRYARKILLTRASDGRGVLFGIVRIDLGILDKQVRAEIEAKQTPLGRVLINHDVLRQVRLIGLYEIKPGHELMKYFAQAERADGGRDVLANRLLYGRTAIIYCDGRPVIELLEIVAA